MKPKLLFIALFIMFALPGQAQWNIINSITFGGIQSINFINADTGFVYNEPGVLRRTSNGGQSWDTIQIKFSGNINDIDFANANVGYAVGGAWFPFGTNYPFAILKTIDGGLTWDSIYTGSQGGVFTHVEAVSETKFFATSPMGMLHSDDGGLSFDTVSVSNKPFGAEQYGRVQFLNTNKGYVMGRSNFFTGNLFNLYETNDGGKSWLSIHDDSTSNFTNDFVMTSTGKGLIIGNDSYVLQTSNGGLNWQKSALDSNLLLVQLEEVNGQLYALGRDVYDTTSCLFHSSDWGNTWQKQFAKKTNTGGIRDLSIPTTGVGYLTTWQEIYKNTQLFSVPEESDQIQNFNVFPNPASENLTLKFEHNTYVKIMIYNNLGQKIKTHFLNGQRIIELNVSTLASGVYFLEIQFGKESVFKKWIKE